MISYLKRLKKRGQKGMAILMVLFFITFVMFLATEIAYESSIEYQFAYSGIRELKAYHGAKSAMELSLFRLVLFKQAAAQFGKQIPDKSMLDMIWSFPMMWPPQLNDDASLIAKDDLNTVLEESLQDTTWIASISPEGSKIDLGDLDSPSEALQKATRKQIEQLIRNRLEREDDWARDNQNLDPTEIVNHMSDYIDKDDESKVGGSEGGYYKGNRLDAQLPPNRMFRTMDELYLIPGMDETLYQHLKPNLSLYGIKAINVNAASNEVLKSIDPQITDEIAKSIKDRINNPDEGPFKNEEEFKSFISREVDTSNFNQDNIPLVFSEESAFMIEVSAEYKTYVSRIKAITYDVDSITKSLETTLVAEAKAKNTDSSGEGSSTGTTDSTSGESGSDSNTGNTNSGTNNSGAAPPKQQKPNIVYWEEY